MYVFRWGYLIDKYNLSANQTDLVKIAPREIFQCRSSGGPETPLSKSRADYQVDFVLLAHLQSVLNLDVHISDGNFHLRMTQQYLGSPETFRAPI